jgi:hypothetical protein
MGSDKRVPCRRLDGEGKRAGGFRDRPRLELQRVS